MEEKELVNKIEAILFALGREITIEELSSNLKEGAEKIESAIFELSKKYGEDSGVKLIEVKGAYQLVTAKKYYDSVKIFVESTKKQNLSTSALETLTIIAYNPKITKSEIEKIRGVNSDFAVSRLQECGLVEEVARLQLPGRPAAYSVTNEFLRSCGIKNIKELPDFENIRIKDEQMLVSDYGENKEEKEKTNNDLS